MSDSVRIREVHIHQALGIRRGSGFELQDLSPGINIVFGPNGCGKSTTCKVVQELLWPGRLERPSVSGLIVDGREEWRIDIDAGYVQSFLDGKSGALPEFGPSESRKRYHLGLTDLIIDDSEDFAKKIADASQGGYDLDDASTTLGFRKRPKSRRKEQAQLQERKGEVEKARQIQLDIQSEADRLEELNAELKDAQEAERELAVLKEAKAYFEILDRCNESDLELSAFPAGVARLQGNEKKQLDELDDKEQDLTERRRTEEEQIREAEATKRQADLPDGEIGKERFAEITAWKNELRKLESRIEEQERRSDEARAEVEKTLGLLGARLSEDQLAAMESLENEDLSAFARKVHRLRADREILEKQRAWLEKDAPDDVQSLTKDEIQSGLNDLTKWLAVVQGEVRRTLLLIVIAALLVAALGITFALTSANWLWALAATLPIALLLLEWIRTRRRDAGHDERRVHRASFERLSLPRPTAWKRANVVETLYTLAELLGKRAISDERRAQLDALQTEEAKLARHEEALDAEREQLQERLGLTITIDDEWLPMLIDRIGDWQSATSRLEGAEAALAELEEKTDAVRSRVGEALAPYGYSEARTADAAEQHIADLKDRSSEHRTASKGIDDARRTLDESIDPDLAAVRKTRKELFDRLEVRPEDAYLIDDWLARRPEYLKCKENVASQRAILDNKRKGLAERPDLLEIDRVDLEQRITESTRKSERRDELNETIGGINARIKGAKAGHELTDALEKYDEARAQLDQARDENCRDVTGAVLTDWVRRVAVERSRPRVFQRANDLFVRFTHGSLELEMDDRSSPPAFVARSGDQPAQSLNQLSDGERIQLMAAVRLAFLEQDESKPLPLLVDEVLGTSDDGRSGVMIDTMVEIAREGRQVFYCTAQHDEVGKWVARLEAEDVDHMLFDLSEIRGLAAARTNPLQIARIEKTAPPRPDGMSYDEYGQTLGVPGIDPLGGTTDRIHLWHLLDDAEMLHELLCKDISTWGQLRTLLEHGGAGLLGSMDGTPARARAAATAIERACEAYRIGRGKPVDRGVLEDSECVSETFIDEVAELCYHLDSDAEALLDALERGEVARFWKKNIDGLREYFEDSGYLAVREPLTRKALRVQVIAAVAGEIDAGLIDMAFVDRVVGSFQLGE